MLPPGQAATNSMPKANAGCGLKIKIKTKVAAGKTINWLKTPTNAAFGVFKSCLKSFKFKSSAMPNIIKPKQIFSIQRLSVLNFMLISSKKGVFYDDQATKISLGPV